MKGEGKFVCGVLGISAGPELEVDEWLEVDVGEGLVERCSACGFVLRRMPHPMSEGYWYDAAGNPCDPTARPREWGHFVDGEGMTMASKAGVDRVPVVERVRAQEGQ
mmetsp:Transcript_18413/g.38548  ORF Transcript_18413/g.38548 Transcript_18413/m.38548 type:complete len:107 (-) Transcript_18413:207-527(-)|eukprot:CAMPEP_0184689688 /NCGR_PEP_ID=MMETSP0312-20130426/30795_1 /TAXON_ID=31354 /ORGANISM="Compsopogon coeruleus, Strain SAG 36.94" /LENGTH=106 /DNA_ID=CAMNT_0027147067 /DNA_START=137 /DNA_END=457 /DNA_ORIENTATION=+